MWRLVPTLVREMGQAYPELMRAEALISETLKLEETRFRKTLERGLAILDEETAALEQRRQAQGRDRLHALRHLRLSARPHAGRAASRAASRSTPTPSMPPWSASARRRAQSWKGSGDAATETVWFGLREKVGATEFLGYETETAEGVVAALVHDGKEVDALKKGETGAVVLNQTPFYGESGGQVGDTGVMTGEGVRFRVTDTQKKAGDVSRASRHGRGGHAQGRRRACARRSIMRAGAPSARITPRPTCCTRRCARCSATMSRRRARWSRPTGCVSISPIPSR